jgi:hypothetical protein
MTENKYPVCLSILYHNIVGPFMLPSGPPRPFVRILWEDERNSNPDKIIKNLFHI